MRCTSKWDQFSTRHARFQVAPAKPVTPVIPLQNGYNAGVHLATPRQPSTLAMTPIYNSNVLVSSPGPATPAYYATPGVLYTPMTTTTHVPLVLSAGPELDTPIALLRSGNRHAATRTPIYINSLALALFARFQRSGDLLDLQDAVSKFREAASLPGASASARQSTTFAVALCAYFFVSHDLNDLDEAISKFKQAVAMTPDGHPDLPGYVASLQDAYALQRSCTCHA
ncbi:hypothetical protein CCMSSC00406_0008629 [Pleurotus cornucopiae]|uniref:Uncharacterized protein n=1 Tax=Pleurotus cornucopiae TaxID=5321 RepID=A0ACB7IGQ6_PLECO|nr:hypothetical protein CCMSSC00406_0008629 [Pleurotus cornucopiae]